MEVCEIMGRRDKDNELTGFLGEGTDYQGNITFEGTLRIDGGFTGCIKSLGTLVVGEKAVINGPVHVGTLICSGSIVGEIIAAGSVVLHRSARLQGSLRTPTLTLEEGALFDGRIVMNTDGAELPELPA
jgi:cytoskeletal protein CcmA (bactofilin family)